MVTPPVLETTIREFARLRELAAKAMGQIDDEGFYRLEGEDNSIAVLVKHLAGNMRSRWSDFLISDGEKPDRCRDQEFELTDDDRRAELMQRWDGGWELLLNALLSLTSSDLDRVVTIRGERHTVLQATLRQLTHYAYHVGQIVLLARRQAGGRWQSLSIPKGMSGEFNGAPKTYLGDIARGSSEERERPVDQEDSR